VSGVRSSSRTTARTRPSRGWPLGLAACHPLAGRRPPRRSRRAFASVTSATMQDGALGATPASRNGVDPHAEASVPPARARGRRARRRLMLCRAPAMTSRSPVPGEGRRSRCRRLRAKTAFGSHDVPVPSSRQTPSLMPRTSAPSARGRPHLRLGAVRALERADGAIRTSGSSGFDQVAVGTLVQAAHLVGGAAGGRGHVDDLDDRGRDPPWSASHSKPVMSGR